MRDDQCASCLGSALKDLFAASEMRRLFPLSSLEIKQQSEVVHKQQCKNDIVVLQGVEFKKTQRSRTPCGSSQRKRHNTDCPVYISVCAQIHETGLSVLLNDLQRCW